MFFIHSTITNNTYDMQRTKLLLFFLFLVFGTLLRYGALEFGYPNYIHPDEGHIVSAVNDILKGKKVEKYGRPDRTPYYFNIAAIKVLSLVRIKTLNKSQRYYLGRFVSLIFGVCSIILAFFIGEQFVNKCGVMFSFTTAFSPLLVENSRYITPEIFNFFFCLAIILSSILYVKKRNSIFLLIAILSCALNTAAKYPAVFTSLVIALAVFIRYFEKGNFKNSVLKIVNVWLFCGVLFMIFFVALFPQLITDFEGVYKKVVQNTNLVHIGVPDIGFLGQLKQYTYFYIIDGGVLYLLVGFLSIFIVAKVKESKTVLFLLIGILIQVFLSYWINSYMVRYAVIMSITPLFFWAYASSYLTKSAINSSNILTKFSLITIVGITCLFFLSKSVVDTKLLTGKTTSLLLQEYKELNNIKEENAIFDRYTYGKKKPANLKISALKKNKYKEFLLISERWYNRFFDVFHKTKYQDRRDFYSYIKNNSDKIIDFKPTSTNFPVIIFSPTSHNKYPFSYFDGFYICKRILFFKNHWNKPVVFGPKIEIYENIFYNRK